MISYFLENISCILKMLIRNSDELRSMTLEQFRWLIQGFAIDPVIHDITPSHSSSYIFCAKHRTLSSAFHTFFLVPCTASQGSSTAFLQSPKLCMAFSFFISLTDSDFLYTTCTASYL